MEYQLDQRARASMDFLNELRGQTGELEKLADAQVKERLADSPLPNDLEALGGVVEPFLRSQSGFRIAAHARSWILRTHVDVAVAAFERMQPKLEPSLQALASGPATLDRSAAANKPAYWQGVDFHRTRGGWDGHPYMGFVHGELILRQMVGRAFHGDIYAFRRAVAEVALAWSPARILELGCSSGPYTQAIAEVHTDAELTAVDVSPRQLEQAQRRANDQALPWGLHEAPAEQTGLADERFDLVTSFALFHEVPGPDAQNILVEALRLLVPGGHILMADVPPYRAFDTYSAWKSDFWNQQWGGDPYWRDYCCRDFAAMASAAGFENVDWSGLGEQAYPYVLVGQKPR